MAERDILLDEEADFDLLFPVVPLEDDPSPPEEDELRLVDDLADFALDELEDYDEDEALAEDLQPGGENFAFDHDLGQFFVNAGEPERVHGEDAVVEWSLKALATPKGEYPIYSSDYGSELSTIIGRVPDGVLEAEIVRTITECCTYHPYVEDVRVLQLRRDPAVAPNGLFATVGLELTSGEAVSFQVGL